MQLTNVEKGDNTMKISKMFEKAIKQIEEDISEHEFKRELKVYILENEKSQCFTIELDFIVDDRLETIYTYSYAKDMLEDTIPRDILLETLMDTIKQLSEEN